MESRASFCRIAPAFAFVVGEYTKVFTREAETIRFLYDRADTALVHDDTLLAFLRLMPVTKFDRVQRCP